MPTLRQLEYLTALATTRHFRKAAEKVGVSQPTLSAQLSTLEERLGVQLVERSRSTVLLTPIGEQVLAASRRVLRDVQEIRDLAASHRGEFGRTIRLGVPASIGPYLLPRVLPSLHRAHPTLKIYVRERVPNALPDALGEGEHDVIVTPLPVRSADFECVPIFREPLYVVTPEDHPLAKKGSVDRNDLRGESVLALERGHQLHEQVEALCEEVGAELLFDFEGTSLETLRQMTALGMGVSFLPGLFVGSMLEKGGGVVALELKGRRPSRTIGMVWRRTSARSSEYELLLGYLRGAIERDFKNCALL